MSRVSNTLCFIISKYLRLSALSQYIHFLGYNDSICSMYNIWENSEVENEENGNDNKLILPEITPGDADLPVSLEMKGDPHWFRSRILKHLKLNCAAIKTG